MYPQIWTTDHKSPTWLILRWPQLMSRWFMYQCDASLYPNHLVTQTRFTSQKTHQETCKASGFCWKGQLEEKLMQGQTPVRSMNSGMMWGQEGKKFIVGGLINDASSKAEITHFLQMSSWTRPGMRQLGGSKTCGLQPLDFSVVSIKHLHEANSLQFWWAQPFSRTIDANC